VHPKFHTLNPAGLKWELQRNLAEILADAEREGVTPAAVRQRQMQVGFRDFCHDRFLGWVSVECQNLQRGVL